MFDKRLQPIIAAVVDVSYGGENGFNQAISLATEALQNVKFVAEKKLISSFFDNIAQDTGMIVFGHQDTMKALELGALETLLLFEDLDIQRYQIKHPVKGDVRTLYLNSTQEKMESFFKDKETGMDLDVITREPLAEWLCNNYQNFGCSLEFITDKS